MRAKLVFLGRLADLVGRPEAEVNFSSPLDWPDIFQWCSDCYSEVVSDAIREPRVRLALNGQIVNDKEGVELTDGDELAFLPPVSGG